MSSNIGPVSNALATAAEIHSEHERDEIAPRAAEQIRDRDHVEREKNHPAPAARHVVRRAVPIKIRRDVGDQRDQFASSARLSEMAARAAAPGHVRFRSTQSPDQPAAASSAISPSGISPTIETVNGVKIPRAT